MEEEYPKFLYHYTSIDNLALILKNKTIRFSSLMKVDDPNEIRTVETNGIGKYCYCSCWTDKEESIPFWNMYTKDMHGVMLKMMVFPFQKHKEFVSYYAGGQIIDTYIPHNIFENNELYTIPSIPFLRKIIYKDNPQVKVFQSIIKNNDGTFDFSGNMNDVGVYKTLAWSFQSEWRYSMILIPHDNAGRINIDVSDTYEGLPQSFFDIEISDAAFKTMEIVTGPKMSEGEKLLVHSIGEKYLPTVNISDSKLKIR